MKSLDELEKNDWRMLYEAYCCLRLNLQFEDFVVKMCNQCLYRRNVLNKLINCQNLLMANERYEAADEVSKLKKGILNLFNESIDRPQVQPVLPVQSYETPCVLNLPRAKKRDLTSYDNRRSQIVDRYSFGIFRLE